MDELMSTLDFLHDWILTIHRKEKLKFSAFITAQNEMPNEDEYSENLENQQIIVFFSHFVDRKIINIRVVQELLERHSCHCIINGLQVIWCTSTAKFGLK